MVFKISSNSNENELTEYPTILQKLHAMALIRFKIYVYF